MELLKRISKTSSSRISLALLIALAFSLLLPSCKKELFELDKLRDPVWEPSAAIPLINSTLEVPDILDRFDDDEIIVVDSDGLLALKYFSNIFSIPAEGLLTLSDQSQSGFFVLTPQQIIDIEGGQGFTTVSQNVTVNYNTPNGEQLTEITFKAGDFTFNYNNQIPHDATVTVTIPDMANGGNVFTSQNLVPANSTRNFSDPLQGYVLDLTSGGTTANEFTINISVRFDDAGGTATPANTFNFDMGVVQTAFSLVRGDIGQPVISTDLDSVRVRIFENSTDGEIFWEDPRIRAIFTNSFGADVEVGIATLASRSSLNPAITVTGTPFGEGSIVNIGGAPSVNTPQVSSFVMDNSTSNIAAVANSSPTKVIYDINVTANPGTGPFVNFMADTSRLELDMELELPFHGWARNFTQEDTTRFDSLQFDDIKEIQSITFRLNIDNGFPVEGFAQVYFLDSTDFAIDSLITDPSIGLFRSGVVNVATGRVTERTQTITDIVLDRDKLDFLTSKGVFDNGAIVSKGVANTTDMGQTTIKIFDTYNMNLRLGALIEGKVTVPMDSLGL